MEEKLVEKICTTTIKNSLAYNKFTKYLLSKNKLIDEPQGQEIKVISCPLPESIVKGTFICNLALS